MFLPIKIRLVVILMTIPAICMGNKLVVSNPNDFEENSLRSIIQAAQTGDTIIFNISNSESDTINLNQELIIEKSLSINGINTFNGDTLILKQLKETERVLTISKSNNHVLIENLKITNGTDGAIYVKTGNNLTLNHCHVFSNKSSYGGSMLYGGIFIAEGSKLILENCKIYNNRGYDAAGLYAYYGTIEIRNSHLYNNSTPSTAPTIYVYSGQLLMDESIISKNTLGIKILDSNATINRSIISDGSHSGGASGGGLGIYGTSKVMVTDSEIVNNYAGTGAGIYASLSSEYSDLTIKRSKILKNRSLMNGGGIYFAGDKLLIDSCLIENNTSYTEGGGICIYDGNDVVIDHTIINKNKATGSNYSGGGLFALKPFKLTNSTISNNLSDLGAGIFYVHYTDTVSWVNNTFHNNRASLKGGAIYANLRVGTIVDCVDYVPSYPGFILVNNTITNNFANAGGGGVFLSPYLYHDGIATFMLFNNIVTYNSNGDIKRDEQTGAASYLGGSNNISTYSGNYENYNLNLINYDSSTEIFTEKYPVPKNNGGFTNTVEISENSIAKGAGLSSIEGVEVPAFDQRGYKRNSPPCIGAYELDGIINSITENKIQRLNFRIENESIYFKTLQYPLHIQIFDMFGRTIYNGTLTGTKPTIKLYKGLFIIKVGDKVSKIHI